MHYNTQHAVCTVLFTFEAAFNTSQHPTPAIQIRLRRGPQVKQPSDSQTGVHQLMLPTPDAGQGATRALHGTLNILSSWETRVSIQTCQ